jgi:predicted metal-dependent hydrolase
MIPARFSLPLSSSLDVDTVRSLLMGWMEARLEEDAWEVVRRRGRPHGLDPSGVHVKELETLWGSCGRDGVLRLDRKLVRLPRPVFEYVVVHELCHLIHRDHSTAFWSLVKRVLPDYQEQKDWLEEHEVRLG